MKKRVGQIEIDELLESFPIRGSIPGWFFRTEETSNNAWVVEGTDRWGRRVSRQGNDPARLLAECENDAAKVDNDKSDT